MLLAVSIVVLGDGGLNGATAGATPVATVNLAVPNGVAVNTSTHVVYAIEQGSSLVTATSCTTSTDGKLAIFSETAPTSIATLTVGCVPIAVAVDSVDNMVFVLNAGAQGIVQTANGTPPATVTIINGATKAVVATVSGFPWYVSSLAVNPTTKQVFVTAGAGSTQTTPGSVTVMSESGGTPTSSCGVAVNPTAIAVDDASNTLFVSNANSDTVTVCNGATGVATANVSLGTGVSPAGLAVDQTTHQAYVVANAGPTKGEIVALSSSGIVSTTLVGQGLEGVAVDGAAGVIFANSTTQKLVYSMNETSATVGASVTTSGESKPTFATSLAVDPGGGELFSLSATAGIDIEAESSFQPPVAPTGVTLTPGSGSLTVAWTASVAGGTLPILYYRVLYGETSSGPFAQSTNAAGSCYVNVTGTSCVLAGLTNGTTYWVEVAAANAAGFGQPSLPVAGSPATAPAAPAAPTVTISGRTATITWMPPANQGSPIVSYAVVNGSAQTVCRTTSATRCATTVRQNSVVQFSVSAANAVGSSAFSPRSALRFVH